MKVIKRSLFNPFSDLKSVERYARELDRDVQDLVNALTARLRVGDVQDGFRSENFSGEIQVFTSSGVADTEFSVTHTLGFIPTGRIILYQDKAGSLYQGPATGTAWTDTTVYFKCDVASVTFAILLLK